VLVNGRNDTHINGDIPRCTSLIRAQTTAILSYNARSCRTSYAAGLNPRRKIQEYDQGCLTRKKHCVLREYSALNRGRDFFWSIAIIVLPLSIAPWPPLSQELMEWWRWADCRSTLNIFCRDRGNHRMGSDGCGCDGWGCRKDGGLAFIAISSQVNCDSLGKI
jgi:hypothetical protein